jgi:manganese/zinc/iron transport system permease protein
MSSLENLLIQALLEFFSAQDLNQFLGDQRTVAILVGALISISGALLGTLLLLRKLSLTSDAISHTVLLGIVVAFLILTEGLGQAPNLSSLWLILGAAAAGVLTVVITEAIANSGLVKSDAALGLAFPLLFAIAVLIVSRYVDDAHIDVDSVFVGEIGLAWANTNSHCFDQCDPISITPAHPRAEIGQTCSNCQTLGISPRDPQAVFEQICSNCGTYSAAAAWRERLIDQAPTLVYFPKALSVMGVITLLNALFVLLFYKELKLATFDAALAAALGFRPQWLYYGLMVMVSLTAVGAFDAVGSILVVAFFVIPPAGAYLLTDRLSRMMLLSPLVGILGAVTGYELARDNFLWVFKVSDVLKLVDHWGALGGYTAWDSSISASMVMMLFFWFVAIWLISPRYGLISMLLRRKIQREIFALHLLLGHLQHHQTTPSAEAECAVDQLHDHLKWPPRRTVRILSQARALQWVKVVEGQARLTERGQQQVVQFRTEQLALH